MKRQTLWRVVFIGLLVLASCTALREEVPRPRPPAGQTRPSSQTSKSTVFCPVKSAGQLCDHRTTALLNLDGEKRVRWKAAVEEYNRAVESAQAQPIKEAEAFIRASQVQEVRSWFAAPKKVETGAARDSRVRR